MNNKLRPTINISANIGNFYKVLPGLGVLFYINSVIKSEFSIYSIGLVTGMLLVWIIYILYEYFIGKRAKE